MYPSSLEVSKVRPKRKPTGSICQGCLMSSNRPRQHQNLPEVRTR